MKVKVEQKMFDCTRTNSREKLCRMVFFFVFLDLIFKVELIPYLKLIVWWLPKERNLPLATINSV